MATISKYTTASGAMLYRVRFRTPDNRQTDKRGFATKRDAEAFAASVAVDMMRGQFISATVGKATIGELGPAWLQRQRGHIKATTNRSYENAWRIHIEPTWGSRRIAGIRHSDVAAWVAELAAKRSPATVAMAFTVLKRILDDAVADRMMPSNPAHRVKLPKRAPRRNIYLTAEQLEHLADESGRYRSLVLLLGVGGLRWGEAVALRVCDVDFLRRRVELHRNATYAGPDAGFVVGSLKSNKSRSVVLPAFITDALAVTAEGKGRDDLLWPSGTGGYLGVPKSADSWLAGAVARCRKPDPTFPRVTVHALRHTAASLAISAGANPKVVQRMLGHASAAMTLDVYADLFDSDLAAVAESVGKMWAREAKPHTRSAPKPL
jgi:integrase